MSWYTKKWWRFALSVSDSLTVRDAEGLWVHLIGSLWILVETT